MMEGLVPHKRALAQLGLSRTSVWRATQCGIEGFPAPVIVRRRIYWRAEDLNHLVGAMMRYEGRGAFNALRAQSSTHSIRLSATSAQSPAIKAAAMEISCSE